MLKQALVSFPPKTVKKITITILLYKYYFFLAITTFLEESDGSLQFETPCLKNHLTTRLKRWENIGDQRRISINWKLICVIIPVAKHYIIHYMQNTLFFSWSDYFFPRRTWRHGSQFETLCLKNHSKIQLERWENIGDQRRISVNWKPIYLHCEAPTHDARIWNACQFHSSSTLCRATTFEAHSRDCFLLLTDICSFRDFSMRYHPRSMFDDYAICDTNERVLSLLGESQQDDVRMFHK